MRFIIIVRARRAILPYLFERRWGRNSETAWRLGPLLGPGSEFAFVLLAAEAIQGVIGQICLRLR